MNSATTIRHPLPPISFLQLLLLFALEGPPVVPSGAGLGDVADLTYADVVFESVCTDNVFESVSADGVGEPTCTDVVFELVYTNNVNYLAAVVAFLVLQKALPSGSGTQVSPSPKQTVPPQQHVDESGT